MKHHCSSNGCRNKAQLVCQKCALATCFGCSDSANVFSPSSIQSCCVHSFIEVAPQKLEQSRLDRESFSDQEAIDIEDALREMSSGAAVLEPSGSAAENFRRFSSNSSDVESSSEMPPLQSTLLGNPFHGDPFFTKSSKIMGPVNSTEFASISIQDDHSSVLLIDSDEKLMCNSGKELASNLQCDEATPVKVISIFGNTGDGKSHTLNHTFFEGKEVFKTSNSQAAGTVGVWAAYDPHTKALVLDTEGLLGATANQNVRSRLLVKIFAISDIIIYRTRSDRLHTDVFQFLGDASAAYLKYFTPELKTISENFGKSISHLGPSLILFHETSFTQPLKDDERSTTTEQVKERFAQINRSPDGFSAIRYIGVRTKTAPTDFSPLREEVVQEMQKTAVRSTRHLQIVFNLLQALNEKFSGPVDNLMMNTLPDEYFTCTVQCMACKSRCKHSMNHLRSGKPHDSKSRCHFEEQFQNKLFVCRSCWQNGQDRIVIPKTAQSGDSVWSGLVKYAWQGYVLECPKCGVIYNSRKYWYGNKSPEEESVREEIAHVWPDSNQIFQGSHNACRQLIDGLSNVAGTISSFTAKPIEYMSDWATDQVAPDYWVPNSDIKECKLCKRPLKDAVCVAAKREVSYDENAVSTEQDSSFSVGSNNSTSSASRAKERHDSENTTKHHCRKCGEGVCDDCSSYNMPVPERGWGYEPVRVCFSCYNTSKTSASVAAAAEDNNNETDTGRDSDPELYRKVKPRIITEAVRSSVSLISSAVEGPKATVLDLTRPAYWTEDSKAKRCYCCERSFDHKLKLHHCRCCGNGVCDPCSPHRFPVPVRGWDYPVRVCAVCFKNGVLS